MDKIYRLWVTKKSGDGYSSILHGWSRNLKFTYKEALEKKKELMERNEVYDVEIFHD